MQKTSERYLHKTIFSSYHHPHSGSIKLKINNSGVKILNIANPVKGLDNLRENRLFSLAPDPGWL
jgi:hypothetical protein